MQSTCENCNKVFSHNRTHARFCCRECQKAFSRVDANCPTCGRAFWYRKSWPRIYCCRSCSASVNAKKNLGVVEVPHAMCEQCGAKIIKDNRTGRRFCSQRCFGDHLSESLKGIRRPNVSGPRPERQNRVTLTCQRCGKEYQVKKSHEHRSKYCSKECTKNQCDIQCKQCGKTYAIKAAEAERTRFCSRECYAEWMTKQTGPSNPRWNHVEARCDLCSTVITIAPFRKSQKHIFCTRQCYNQWYSENKSGANSHEWRGGKRKSRGPSWNRQRRKALRRDKYACQHCGITQKKLGRCPDVHHIIPFREFGIERHEEANSLENLVTLCSSCHQKAEHGVIPIQPYLLLLP